MIRAVTAIAALSLLAGCSGTKKSDDAQEVGGLGAKGEAGRIAGLWRSDPRDGAATVLTVRRNSTFSVETRRIDGGVDVIGPERTGRCTGSGTSFVCRTDDGAQYDIELSDQTRSVTVRGAVSDVLKRQGA